MAALYSGVLSAASMASAASYGTPGVFQTRAAQTELEGLQKALKRNIAEGLSTFNSGANFNALA